MQKLEVCKQMGQAVRKGLIQVLKILTQIFNVIVYKYIIYNQLKMEPRKQQKMVQWRQNNQLFYDFIYENFLDWPCSSVQWGPLLQQTSQYTQQRLAFAYKTDGLYSPQQRTWQNTPNYIVLANVQIPNQDHYFINDLKALFNYDAAKKHPHMKIKQIITHPGQITVLRSCPSNRKILASKCENNIVNIWTADKYKLNHNTAYATTPDYVLMTTKSDRPNYALRFSPTLPRVISASGDKLQVFDVESPITKRQLGSVLSSNLIKPHVILEGHDRVQDITFKSNQICISGGQDKQIGIWDMRIGTLEHKIKEIHTNDINSITIKDNYIVSGGEEGRINIIDDRTLKPIFVFQQNKPIYSVQFNPINDMLAVGSDHLAFYTIQRINESQKFQPVFVHHGMRGNINEIDWNIQCPNSIVATCQQTEPDTTSHGGMINIFRPIDLFFMKKSQAINSIKDAYKKLKPEERKAYKSQ